MNSKTKIVEISGAVTKQVSSAAELYRHFEAGSSNRHVAATNMNSESSRSHLIIGIVITSTNLATGAVLNGKLRFVACLFFCVCSCGCLCVYLYLCIGIASCPITAFL